MAKNWSMNIGIHASRYRYWLFDRMSDCPPDYQATLCTIAPLLVGGSVAMRYECWGLNNSVCISTLFTYQCLYMQHSTTMYNSSVTMVTCMYLMVASLRKASFFPKAVIAVFNSYLILYHWLLTFHLYIYLEMFCTPKSYLVLQVLQSCM